MKHFVFCSLFITIYLVKSRKNDEVLQWKIITTKINVGTIFFNNKKSRKIMDYPMLLSSDMSCRRPSIKAVTWMRFWPSKSLEELWEGSRVFRELSEDCRVFRELSEDCRVFAELVDDVLGLRVADSPRLAGTWLATDSTIIWKKNKI